MSNIPIPTALSGEGPSPQAARSARNRVFAKAVVAANLGAALGFAAWLWARQEARRAASLTLAKYTADFDSYRTGLVEDGKVPLVAYAIFTALCSLLVAGLYELLSRGLLLLITRTRVGRFISPWGSDPRDGGAA